MPLQPLLTTQRLLLRPLQLSDATRVQALAGDEQIANGTLNIPHPYTDGVAGQWIGKHLAGWHRGQSAIYAITLKTSQQLIGCIGLHNIQNGKAQLGYWIGVPLGARILHRSSGKNCRIWFQAPKTGNYLWPTFQPRDEPRKSDAENRHDHVMTKNDAVRVNMITENMNIMK